MQSLCRQIHEFVVKPRGARLLHDERATAPCRPVDHAAAVLDTLPTAVMKERHRMKPMAFPPARRILVSLLLLLTVVCSDTAKTYAQPVEPVLTPEGYVFSEKLSVGGLLDFVSSELDISFIWDEQTEQKLTSATSLVTLRMRRAVSEEELFSILEVVLQSTSPQPFTIIETSQPGLYRLMPGARTAQPSESIYFLDAGEHLPADPENRAMVITVIARIGGSSPQEVIAGMNLLLTPSGQAQPIGSSGLMIFSGSRSRVETALRLIEMASEVSDEPTFEIFELENADATSAIPALNQLIQLLNLPRPGARTSPARATVAIQIPGTRRIMVVCTKSQLPKVRDFVKQLDTGTPSEMKIYSATILPADEMVTLINGVLRTPTQRGAAATTATVQAIGSTVLVYATANGHAKVEELIATLEEVPPSARQVVRYFKVLNRDAAEILDVLESLFEGGVIEGEIDRSAAPAQDRGRRAEAEPQPMPQEGAPPGTRPASLASADEVLLDITLDEATNTLIARGEPRLIDQVESLVRDLDVRQPQVMLQAFLVTLSENEALEVGMELQGEFQWGTTSFDLSSLFGLGLTNATSATPGTPGTGFTGLAVNPGDFSAILRALQTVGAGQAMSRPYMLVNNNEQAELKGIAKEPYSDTNQGESTTTTSYGGTEDAGTTLIITPKIAEGNHLILEYSVVLSSFTGAAINLQGGGRLPPPSREDSMNSVVTIPDGYTVVVGGLEDTAEKTTVNKIPILSDIPIIGELFKSTVTSNKQNRLYVFIQATILRDPRFQDLIHLSSEDLIHAGIESGLPAIEPVWID